MYEEAGGKTRGSSNGGSRGGRFEDNGDVMCSIRRCRLFVLAWVKCIITSESSHGVSSEGGKPAKGGARVGLLWLYVS